MATIVHVIAQVGRGGASRAMLTAATASAEARGYGHRVVSLRPAVGELPERLAAAGLTLVDAPARRGLDDELAAADIVHLHFWNSPELQELLRSKLPPMRLVAWCHVGGDRPPQILPPELVEFADSTVTASPHTASLPAIGAADCLVIEPVAEPRRSGAIARRPRDGLKIGYLGTVDPLKMHPRFVELSAAVKAPEARFVVAGTGDGFAAIARRAEALGVRERFELRGYVPDPGPLFAELDVFGYPLCRHNYSASELVLQEAMRAGVPPVMLANGAATASVSDGETGIIAADERAYVSGLERLGQDDELRARLSHEARRQAQLRWSLAGSGAAWSGVYEGLLERPKRRREWPGPATASGAELFVAALGEAGGGLRAGLAGDNLEAAIAADESIAAVPPVLANADGGVLDYRRRYPADPLLRLWAGLVLAAQGRGVLAAGELSEALRRGCDRRRAEPRLTAITRGLAERRNVQAPFSDAAVADG